MKKRLSMPSLLLSLLLVIVLEYLMAIHNVTMPRRIVGGILFFLFNALFLTLLIRALTRFAQVFRLPGVRLFSYAYYLYPAALLLLYLTFLFGMGTLAGYEIPPYWLAGLIVFGTGILILAQLGGAFPSMRISQKKRALRLEAAGGRLGGFDLLGTLIGQYRDGIILGTVPVPFAQIGRMHRVKDALILEGLGDTRLEVIAVSQKAQEKLIPLLKDRVKTSPAVLTEAFPVKKEKAGTKAGKDKRTRKKPVRLLKAGSAKPVSGNK